MFKKHNLFQVAVIFTAIIFTSLLAMSVIVPYCRVYSGHTGLDMAKMQKLRTQKEAQP